MKADKDRLSLVVKKEFFDMILSGYKKEEYRAITKHWRRLLENSPNAMFVFNPRKYKTVQFINGYRKDARRILLECNGITTGEPNKKWCGTMSDQFEYCYIIKIGSEISRKNC